MAAVEAAADKLLACWAPRHWTGLSSAMTRAVLRREEERKQQVAAEILGANAASVGYYHGSIPERALRPEITAFAEVHETTEKPDWRPEREFAEALAEKDEHSELGTPRDASGPRDQSRQQCSSQRTDAPSDRPGARPRGDLTPAARSRPALPHPGRVVRLRNAVGRKSRIRIASSPRPGIASATLSFRIAEPGLSCISVRAGTLYSLRQRSRGKTFSQGSFVKPRRQ